MRQTLAKRTAYFTVERYLQLEREADERGFYLDGEIYGMAGESPAHADICVNLIAEFRDQLRNGPCRVRSKDTKVRSGVMPLPKASRKGFFFYPDLVVICGEPKYHDDHKDVILNPQVIVEVLSESTESFDRGGKFLRLRNYNETLTDYLLVSQTTPCIEHFQRQANGVWQLQTAQGKDSVIEIASINMTLPLRDVYERVEFAEVEN
jgi:Uma2 family endonuclease